MAQCQLVYYGTHPLDSLPLLLRTRTRTRTRTRIRTRIRTRTRTRIRIRIRIRIRRLERRQHQQLSVGLPEDPGGEPDPEGVEEEEVEPLVDPV